MRYKIQYTENAGCYRDDLPIDQMNELIQGVGILANDPYAAPSRAIDDVREERHVRLGPHVTINYVVIQARLMIVVLTVLSDEQSLVAKPQ